MGDARAALQENSGQKSFLLSLIMKNQASACDTIPADQRNSFVVIIVLTSGGDK